MAALKLFCIIFLIYVKYSMCYKYSIHRQVEEINNLSKQMYGDVAKDYWQFKTQNVDDLLYPNGNKHKLSLLASLWRDYYSCSLSSLDKLTAHGQVPSVIVTVYAGAVARLMCSVCVAPNERNALKWLYAEFTTNMTFNLLEEDERMVLAQSNLTIYNVKTDDAGVYRCEIGDSRSMVILEVVDDDDYDVVKPATTRGPYATPGHTLDNGLTVFSAWSPWSECSVCGKVGRRHRHGMCYLKLSPKLRTKRTFYNDMILDKNDIGLFEAFPGGFPCQSPYLPLKLRIDEVKQRRNEIMIAMCKVACNDMIYYARSETGDIVETANNTAGIYSLAQSLPKQPPVPVRDTIFAEFGQWIAIRCSGTTLRDVPVTWRIGTKSISPRELDQSTGGRIYINARDHLVINRVYYRDANLYSCWQRGRLCVAVRVLVPSRVTSCSPRGGGALLLLLLVALLLLRVTLRAARNTRDSVHA